MRDYEASEEAHSHAAHGPRQTRGRQHGPDDSEVRPPVRQMVLKPIERATDDQLDETDLQELQRGLIVPDLDPVRVAAVAYDENTASRPV